MNIQEKKLYYNIILKKIFIQMENKIINLFNFKW